MCELKKDNYDKKDITKGNRNESNNNNSKNVCLSYCTVSLSVGLRIYLHANKKIRENETNTTLVLQKRANEIFIK